MQVGRLLPYKGLPGIPQVLSRQPEDHLGTVSWSKSETQGITRQALPYSGYNPPRPTTHKLFLLYDLIQTPTIADASQLRLPSAATHQPMV